MNILRAWILKLNRADRNATVNWLNIIIRLLIISIILFPSALLIILVEIINKVLNGIYDKTYNFIDMWFPPVKYTKITK
jgi:hypothetical protein